MSRAPGGCHASALEKSQVPAGPDHNGVCNVNEQGQTLRMAVLAVQNLLGEPSLHQHVRKEDPMRLSKLRLLQMAGLLTIVLCGVPKVVHADAYCDGWCAGYAQAHCGAGNYTIDYCTGTDPNCQIGYSCNG
jgi:hypothetical protein